MFDEILEDIRGIQEERDYSDFTCMDCGRNTEELGDYYMLNTELWHSVTTPEERKGLLCIECLEKRIGRKLTPKDFLQCRLNTKDSVWFDAKRPRSDILKDRLGFEKD